MRKIALLCAALALALAAPPARAVVTGTTTEVSYTGNGSTTVYPFSFKATDKAWVKVYLAGVSQASGFTVTLNTNQDAAPGGSVTFTAAPGSGVAVRLERVIPLTQPTVLLDGARFAPKVVEHGIDLPVLLVQQVDQRVAKAEAKHAADIETLAHSYDLIMYFPGKPLAGQVLARVVIPRVAEILTGAAGSMVSAGAASTSTVIFDMKKNGAAFGTVTFTPAGASLSVPAAVLFSPGDALTVTAGNADATLSDVSLTLAAVLP